MTAKTWCAISNAVERVKTARNTTAGTAQAWLIAACAAGDIRSRVPSSLGSEVLLNDNRRAGIDVRARGHRRRVPEPVSPDAWKDAVIDGDVLVANDGRWFGIEISIADLEFDLKGSLAPSGIAPAVRQSDKEAIVAEAQRRVTADESIPPTLSAFARELHFWLDRQPRVLRRTKTAKVLGPASIEEHIRPLKKKVRRDAGLLAHGRRSIRWGILRRHLAR
jgi:hypothetical protein